MKSPTSSVGRIEELGILNGSATKDRSRNTISSTGKKLFGYSIHHGSGTSPRRRLAKYHRSARAMTPVATVSTNRMSAKFIRSVAGNERPGAARAQRCPIESKPSARSGAVHGHGSALRWSGQRRPPSFLADLQDREESFLWDLDAADRLHALLTSLLLLEQFALARDVAAVALRQHVLAQRLDALARDDLGANGRLDCHVEHLPRNELAHLGDDFAAAILRMRPVNHHRKRVDALAVDQDVELHDVGSAKLLEFVIERGIAPRHGLQPVEKVHDDLGQRQLVDQHDLAADVLHVFLYAALLGAQRQHRAHIFLRHENRRGDDRLADLLDARKIRQLGRILDVDQRTVPQQYLIHDRRRSSDEVHVVFALESFLHDIHVQETEEAAAEAEAQRLRDLGLVMQRRVVQLQFLQRVAQRFVLVGLDRIQAREDLRLDFLDAGERLRGRSRRERHRVADAGRLELLDAGDDEADIARLELGPRHRLGREYSDLLAVVGRARRHE